jgi:hypothetical protein
VSVCEICGEGFVPETRGDGTAEMAHADDQYEMYPSVIVHYQCGLDRGLVLA